MIFKKSRITLLISILILLSANPAYASPTITISQNEISVPFFGTPAKSAKIPTRIVSLANGAAEVIVSLGLKSHLVGRDIASSFTGDARIPIVTQAHAISAEKVLAVRPTLVLINASTGPAAALKQLRSAGVKIAIIPEAYSLSGMRFKYASILRALSINPKDPVAIKLLDSIPDLSQNLGGQTGIAFLYLRGTSGIYLLGGKGSGADALIRMAGGTDVGATQGSNPFMPLTPEALVAINPSIILVMQKGLESVGGSKGLFALSGIAQTPAGINQKVIAVDDSLLLAFGPRTQGLIIKLATAIESLK
jgi:iron complex transport system substrate-binding protein